MNDERLTDLSVIVLEPGTHAARGPRLNAMEAAAWLAGEPHTSEPVSVAPSLRELVRLLNAQAPDAARQQLKAVLPGLIGTANRGDEAARVLAIGRWAAAHRVPMALEGEQLRGSADRLRGASEVADTRAAEAAERSAATADRSGRASVAAHAAAYERADAMIGASQPHGDPAASAAEAVWACTAAREHADRRAEEAMASAVVARAAAATATAAARANDDLWPEIMESVTALIRRIS